MANRGRGEEEGVEEEGEGGEHWEEDREEVEVVARPDGQNQHSSASIHRSFGNYMMSH